MDLTSVTWEPWPPARDEGQGLLFVPFVCVGVRLWCCSERRRKNSDKKTKRSMLSNNANAVGKKTGEVWHDQVTQCSSGKETSHDQRMQCSMERRRNKYTINKRTQCSSWVLNDTNRKRNKYRIKECNVAVGFRRDTNPLKIIGLFHLDSRQHLAGHNAAFESRCVSAHEVSVRCY